MTSSCSTETQIAIVHNSFPRISLSRVLLRVLELLFVFLIVLSAQSSLSLPLFLPSLNCCVSILLSLCEILLFLHHFFMLLLLHLLLLITTLLDLFFFLFSQIIVLGWLHLHSIAHAWHELLLLLVLKWELNLFPFWLHLSLHGHRTCRLLKNEFFVGTSFVKVSKRVH